MAILGDIRGAYERGEIKISPFDVAQINPNSYNVRIDTNTLMRHDAAVMKWGNTDYLFNKDLWLYPGEFYLANTVEVIGSEIYAPMLEGRSTVGRHGVSVHATAGFGDIGYVAKWTLEITVVKPIELIPNMLIAQVAFFKPDAIVNRYSGNYRQGNIFPLEELKLT